MPFHLAAVVPIPARLPLYRTIPPDWDAGGAARFASRLSVHGDAVDAGAWFVVRGDAATVEVYQASHSFRFEERHFHTESDGSPHHAPDGSAAVAAAEAFFSRVDGVGAQATLESVTELMHMSFRPGHGSELERRVIALQVNYRYQLDGLPLLGPGAKAQATVDPRGHVTQAYKFWRELKQEGTWTVAGIDNLFSRLASSPQLATLHQKKDVTFINVRVGWLCLPPTEPQGVLMPVFEIQGEVTTEERPNHRFIVYLAAGDHPIGDGGADRWIRSRPALVIA